MILAAEKFFFSDKSMLVDENVVVGSAPASADKTSIVDFGNDHSANS